MKVKYIVLVLALASVFSACSRDEENLFDKSAAERAQAALDNAIDILTAPANGWEMIYFANPDSRGYNLLVTFDKNGKVTATAKNSLTTGNVIKSDSSTWEVINDYGPILTFNTYNEVLHAWADPRSDGDGYLGDYEFLILHADANYVKLKGKKHSAYYYLYPLETGVTAAQYFSEVEAMDKRLFGNGNLLHVQANNEEYMLYDGASGIFMLAGLGETPNTEEPESYPVAAMRNGIQFMSSPRALGDTRYTIKGDKMESSSSSIFAAPAIAYFTEYIRFALGSWKIDIKNINDVTKDLIAKTDEALKASYSGNKKKASVQGLRYKLYEGNIVVIFSYIGSGTKANDIMYSFDVATEGNAIKVAYKGPANEAAQNVLTAFPVVADLLSSLNGNLVFNTTDALNPSNGGQLIDQNNSAIWFNITGAVE